MARCAAKTHKKAWNNPLAPRAQCTRDAAEGSEFCAIHSPEAKAKRNERVDARWAGRMDRIRAENEREHRRYACEEACDGLDLGGLKTGSLSDALRALAVLVDDGEPAATRALAIGTGREALRSLGRL